MNPEQFFDALALVPNFRSARFNDLEITDGRDGFLHFEGHAAVFDEVAELEIPNLGVVTESVQRGAFRKVLKDGGNVPLTIEHDPTRVLATTGSGLLRLEEDTKGLRVEADVPDTTMARDLQSMVKNKVINGMSFGFVSGPRANFKVERRNGTMHRTLLGFKKILDVCTTWDPAYRSAEAQFRSMTMQYADSAESLQQLLMGAYPQLGERADEPVDTEEETEETVDTESVDERTEDEVEREEDRVDDDTPQQRSLSLAAARNRVLLVGIDLKGTEMWK